MLVHSRLIDLFPPPDYLRLPSVGVDISDTSLKYIHFTPNRRGGRNLKLAHWGDLDIAEGVLSRGEVHEQAKLADAIRQVREKTGVDFVRVSLPEEKAYLFETDIKRDTDPKEIRGLLEFRLEENVPIAPRDAHFDFHVFDHRRDGDALTVSVTVYAREVIEQYYQACQQAGVTPLSFEVEAQAIARASLPPGDTSTHLIVDFGKTRTGIGIVHQGVLTYTSTIDMGGNTLSAALRRQLGEKPESELTEIKNTAGLVRGVNDSAVYESLITTMSAIKDEIALRLQYWNKDAAKGEDRYIEDIILCGGSANLKGLPGYLHETLGIPAHRAHVWQNAFSLHDIVPPIDRHHSYGYATAIGLGLAGYV
jgi:type IV pilus assembly protein PilM